MRFREKQIDKNKNGLPLLVIYAAECISCLLDWYGCIKEATLHINLNTSFIFYLLTTWDLILGALRLIIIGETEIMLWILLKLARWKLIWIHKMVARNENYQYEVLIVVSVRMIFVQSKYYRYLFWSSNSILLLPMPLQRYIIWGAE